MDKVQKYLEIMQIAQGMSAGLLAIIRGAAQQELTDAQFATLQDKWDALVVRTAKNAGLTT